MGVCVGPLSCAAKRGGVGLIVEQGKASQQSFEHLVESLLIWPLGEIEDIVLFDLLTQTGRPSTTPPGIVKGERAENVAL